MGWESKGFKKGLEAIRHNKGACSRFLMDSRDIMIKTRSKWGKGL